MIGPASTEFELVTVMSGARTVRSLQNGETFHPVVGPRAEARALHVLQQRLVERARATKGRFVIWDVGLGAGANALAVLDAFGAEASDVSIELHSFDETCASLEFALNHADQLEYLAPHTGAVRSLLRFGTVVHSRVNWRLHL